MKFLIATILMTSTLVYAGNNKIIIKKEFFYDNEQPSSIGKDYTFYKKGKDWVKSLNGLKAFSRCKLIEIDELGQKNGKFMAKLTAECME
jgi:hypothetical protein